MSTPEPPAARSRLDRGRDDAESGEPARARRRRTSRSARCCPTTRPGSATSGSTRGSAPPRPGSRSPRTTTQNHAGHGDPAVRGRRGRRGRPSPVRRRDQRACTSTPCWPAAGRARTPAGWAASSAARTTTRSPPTTRLVAPWVALAYDGSPAAAAEAERDPRRGAARHAAAAGHARPARTTSSTGSTGSGPGWPGSGRCPGPDGSTGPAGGPSWSPGC